MTAYYNEIDAFAAQWLRNLIAAGHIAPGIVDERSIEDVLPSDLAGFTQCHFFAGIGVWSLALRNAGWPDEKPVWTGSCPCQPFSTAGKGAGFADERHLWPAWFHLISQCKPTTVFGEQVASRDGLGWLDVVHADMEAAGYAVAAADLCAAGVGAPHIRQRLWFVADSKGNGHEWARRFCESAGRDGLAYGCAVGGMAYSNSERLERIDALQWAERENVPETTGSGSVGLMCNASNTRLEGHRQPGDLTIQKGRQGEKRYSPSPGITRGFWADADWLYCRDDKWRPVEPGTFPMAHGVAGRVGRLRAYGNAINAEAAKTFIKSTGLA